MNIISFRKAVNTSLILFGLLFLFHLLIISGILFFNYAPTDYLWGGRMQTEQELLNFEILSLSVTGFCLFIVLIRAEILKVQVFLPASRVFLWIFFFLFLLNTIGNILAKSDFEKYFALLTVLLAFLCLRMALEPLKAK